MLCILLKVLDIEMGEKIKDINNFKKKTFNLLGIFPSKLFSLSFLTNEFDLTDSAIFDPPLEEAGGLIELLRSSFFN